MPTQKQTVRAAKKSGHFVHAMTPFDEALFELQAFESKNRLAGITSLKGAGARRLLPSNLAKITEKYDELKFSVFTFSDTKIRTTRALCSRVIEIMARFNLETPQEMHAFLSPMNGVLFEIHATK